VNFYSAVVLLSLIGCTYSAVARWIERGRQRDQLTREVTYEEIRECKACPNVVNVVKLDDLVIKGDATVPPGDNLRWKP
jgi:uncharacterized OsmC-like protein